MERLRVTCKGPARIIVPLSESEPDRWMFNDLLEFEGVREATTPEELKKWYGVMCDMQEEIREDDMVRGDRESMRRFHRTLYDRLMRKEPR